MSLLLLFRRRTVGTPPSVASGPTPADGAVGLTSPVAFAWTAAGATDHVLYFGTNPAALGLWNASWVPNTIPPQPFAEDGTTYYWRVDARNADGTTPGPVWSFTMAAPAPPSVATGPTPANGATGVTSPVDFAWTAAGATDHILYFGLAPGSLTLWNPAYIPNTIADQPIPEDGAPRFWRVDARNAAGVTTGPVWSFTMAAPLPTAPTPINPTPADGAIALPTVLTWEAPGAETFDVYFGTTTTPPLVSSGQTAASYPLDGYAPRVLVDGPSHYWRLNEASGLVAADAVGGADGAITGDVTLGAAGALADGSTAMQSGTSGRAQAAGVSLVGPFTIEIWVKFPSAATAHSVFENTTLGAPTADRIVCWVQATNGLNTIGIHYASGSPADQYFNIGAWPGPDGLWHLFTVVIDGAQCRGYIDGAPGITTTLTRAFGGHAAPFRIGSGWAGPVNGFLDEVAIYPRALTATQIAAHYARRVAAPALVAGTYYWRVVSRVGVVTASGALWSFTVAAPGVPLSPTPPHNSTEQSANVDLAWSGAAGATGFDVYFGTSTTPPLVSSNQPLATFDPGPLTIATMYRWRIVARNAVGTTSGPLWRFTTLTASGLVIEIDGLPWRVRKAGMQIRDLLADTPNTAAFTVEGAAPAVGMEVRIGLGTLDPVDVIFGGVIDTVDAIYESLPEHRAWHVTCQDYTPGLNRRKVRIRYAQQSATAIALDLLTRYAPISYTAAHVAAGLPTVDGGIDFTEEDLTACFARLATRIGGYWYVDYARAVHLFLTESVNAPDPIVPGGRLLMNDPPIAYVEDLTQIRTRVFVEGGGSQARSPVAPGATTIPVTDGGWYLGSGGVVVSGPQRITYTGKGAAGGPAAPTSAPSATPGNLGTGPYTYKVASVLSGVESPLSAASSPPIVFGAVPDPSSPVGLVYSTHVDDDVSTGFVGLIDPGGNIEAGLHGWVSTQVTATGETAPVLVDYANLGAASNVRLNNLWMALTGQGPALSRRIYRTAAGADYNVASNHGRVGEIGPSGAGVFMDEVPDAFRGPAPGATNTTGGALTAGTYLYKVTFITPTGETSSNTGQNITVAAASAVLLSGVPVSADGRVTGRRIYRTAVNSATYRLLATIPNNTATTYVDRAADAALGATLVDVNTTGGGGRVSLSAIATPPGATARRIYRTISGGALYKFLAAISDNTTTVYTDNTADGSLGANAPVDVVTELTGIPASGPGAVLYDILAGDPVNLFVQCDDVPAQVAQAARVGEGDGIVEHYMQDRRLSAGQATAHGNADLALFAHPIMTVRYVSRDPKTRSGKTILIALPSIGLVGDFTIQSVMIDDIDASPGLFPRYTVEASSVRFSFEDVLRRLRLLE